MLDTSPLPQMSRWWAESLTLREDPTDQLPLDTADGEGRGFEPVHAVTVPDVFRAGKSPRSADK